MKRWLIVLAAVMFLSHTAFAIYFSPSVETWFFSCNVLSAPEVGGQRQEGEPAAYIRFSSVSTDGDAVATANYDGLYIWEISDGNLRASGPWDFETYNENKYQLLYGDPDGDWDNWDNDRDDLDDDRDDTDDYDDSGEDYNEEDELETVYLCEGDIAGFIMRDGKIVILVVDGDDSRLLFYTYGSEALQSEIQLREWDEDEEMDEEDSPPLPLLLDTGILLYADALGNLFTCEPDGTGIQAVPNASAAEFVYYDGYVYFANLADRVAYDAYSEPDDEFFPVEYPRLYRVRLDGTGLERLSEGGVRGLCSQGRYIFYQSLDDQYEGSKANEYPLMGVVYGYNAEKEESHSLGIGDVFWNACIPTPYGLAVWDSTYSPYDIDYMAKLAFYDFDGTFIRPLHADPLLLWMYDAQVVRINDHLDRNAICFHYNSEYSGEEGHHLFIIPLNGDDALLS